MPCFQGRLWPRQTRERWLRVPICGRRAGSPVGWLAVAVLWRLIWLRLPGEQWLAALVRARVQLMPDSGLHLPGQWRCICAVCAAAPQPALLRAARPAVGALADAAVLHRAVVRGVARLVALAAVACAQQPGGGARGKAACRVACLHRVPGRPSSRACAQAHRGNRPCDDRTTGTCATHRQEKQQPAAAGAATLRGFGAAAHAGWNMLAACASGVGVCGGDALVKRQLEPVCPHRLHCVRGQSLLSCRHSLHSLHCTSLQLRPSGGGCCQPHVLQAAWHAPDTWPYCGAAHPRPHSRPTTQVHAAASQSHNVMVHDAAHALQHTPHTRCQLVAAEPVLQAGPT